jgi:hypothetical protein
LYYVPRNHDEAGTPPKDSTFLEFAEQLFRRARKMTQMVDTDWGRERLGRAAASKVRDGQLQLAANPPSRVGQINSMAGRDDSHNANKQQAIYETSH